MAALFAFVPHKLSCSATFACTPCTACFDGAIRTTLKGTYLACVTCPRWWTLAFTISLEAFQAKLTIVETLSNLTLVAEHACEPWLACASTLFRI